MSAPSSPGGEATLPMHDPASQEGVAAESVGNPHEAALSSFGRKHAQSATAQFVGFYYQALRTIYLWLTMKQGSALVVEGLQDIDHYMPLDGGVMVRIESIQEKYHSVEGGKKVGKEEVENTVRHFADQLKNINEKQLNVTLTLLIATNRTVTAPYTAWMEYSRRIRGQRHQDIKASDLVKCLASLAWWCEDEDVAKYVLNNTTFSCGDDMPGSSIKDLHEDILKELRDRHASDVDHTLYALMWEVMQRMSGRAARGHVMLTEAILQNHLCRGKSFGLEIHQNPTDVVKYWLEKHKYIDRNKGPNRRYADADWPNGRGGKENGLVFAQIPAKLQPFTMTCTLEEMLGLNNIFKAIGNTFHGYQPLDTGDE